MLCTVAVTKEDDIYIAKDIRTSVASQGTTPENALSNLKEAMELYYDGNDVPTETMPIYTTMLEVSV